MKKIFLIAFILMFVLSGCEGNGPRGNKRLGDDLLPDYTITTMPPHSYAELSGTYLESLISSGESMYDSIYESMYPSETDRWGGMQTVTGIITQKSESITMPPNNDIFPTTSICVRNPTDEEFEILLSDSISSVTTVDLENEDINMTTSVTTKKTKLIAVTGDTAETTTTTIISSDTE